MFLQSFKQFIINYLLVIKWRTIGIEVDIWDPEIERSRCLNLVKKSCKENGNQLAFEHSPPSQSHLSQSGMMYNMVKEAAVGRENCLEFLSTSAGQKGAIT